VGLRARLQKLERQQSQISRQPFRVVVSHAGERLDLTKATCTRTLMPDGQLMELVNLHGSSDGLSEEELERFVQGFPIERSMVR
jgi:hypothetical protein